MTNPAAQTAARFTVIAVIWFHGEARRTHLGSAPSRRKARRIGYREGLHSHPSRFSSAIFELEILDTVTGATVRAPWAEEEAYQRNRRLPTVADRGIW